MTDFACAACDCPSVALPDELTADAVVRCYRCRAPIGTWTEFCDRTARLIATAFPPMSGRRSAGHGVVEPAGGRRVEASVGAD